MTEPDHDCSLCPRLRSFVLGNRRLHPDWHNGPVGTWQPPEGPGSVRILVVGLAPGLRGANRTGIPFTGDQSGDLLYATLGKVGLAVQEGKSGSEAGLRLNAVAITNAVRCVPPGNKPSGAEVNTCRRFLKTTLEDLPALEVIVTLGKVAHDSTVRAFGGAPAHHPFGHGLETGLAGKRILSSYHCSRYNVNTGRLTADMFEAVFAAAVGHLAPP